MLARRSLISSIGTLAIFASFCLLSWPLSPSLSPALATDTTITTTTTTTTAASSTDAGAPSQPWPHQLPRNHPEPSAARLRQWPSWRSVQTAFVFGDSYSDSFFDPGQAPYPSRALPLGNDNRTYPSGPRSAKWPSFLFDPAGAARAVPAFNFAISGSSVTANLWPGQDTPLPPTVPPLDMQVAQGFLPLCAPAEAADDSANNNAGPGPADACVWQPATSVFFVWSGINDVFAPLVLGTRWLPDRTALSYLASLRALYAAGARNFLLMTLPPLELLGSSSAADSDDDEAAGAAEAANARRALVAEFNGNLRHVRNAVMAECPDATARVFDANALWRDVLARPSLFAETGGLTRWRSFCYAYAGR